jgi:hypothetical protein
MLKGYVRDSFFNQSVPYVKDAGTSKYQVLFYSCKAIKPTPCPNTRKTFVSGHSGQVGRLGVKSTH